MTEALENVTFNYGITGTLKAIEHRVCVEHAQEELLSNVGCPHLEVSGAAIKSLMLSGITVRDIADMFAVTSTIHWRLVEEGLRFVRAIF